MINKIVNILNEYRKKKKIQSIIQQFDKGVNIDGDFPGYRYIKNVTSVRFKTPVNGAHY
jgi:hypothetical protein